MSAVTHLAQYNVTVEQARSFIVNNLDNLPHIISVCADFGVTNQMLAEIYGGVSADQVVAFFAANHIDSTLLDAGSSSGTDNTDQVPEAFSDYINTFRHGQNDGYHDGYLSGFTEADWGAKDGGSSAEYGSGYDSQFGNGYQDGLNQRDYEQYYAGENNLLAPQQQITLADLGRSDGYKSGYLAGLYYTVNPEEAPDAQSGFYNIDINDTGYANHYNQFFYEGLADGKASSAYEEDIYTNSQLPQSVIDLFS